MRTVVSPGMPEYQIFGMINFANETFAYADTPDDDEDFDSDDYDPDWYKRQ
jgi:hypothetical protein